ncbi:hypothetical protein MKZ38_001356 [Zalerion maritima]|uniref:NADH-ubiquinone oxidoreductase 21.3 kDa subunit n=1 Tax=Zalerion maritima TaxID=339359 RepID=A0AAD5WRZ7_9PEZI|nr:hypothetical protein MKZ38_001356 [Zalerion maritima]
MGEVRHEPVDAIKLGSYGALFGGGCGLFAAAVQNALAKHNVGAWGVFTRSGLLITGVGATSGATIFTAAVMANLRETRDWKNWSAGGFAGGVIQGLIARSMPKVFGFGLSFAAILGAADYTGGLVGHNRINHNADEYEEKERMRRTRRRPIEETLEFVGEGRGIKPPGYEERRVQRLKEKYGVEINTVSAVATDEET